MTSSRTYSSRSAHDSARPQPRRRNATTGGQRSANSSGRGNNNAGRGNNTGRGNSSGRAAAPAISALDAALDASLKTPLPAGASFESLGLPAPLVDILAKAGITTPTPIQARTLPDALAGRDLLGRAETGSGKTLGFGLPMLTRLAAVTGRAASGAPRGLALVPTRELAAQVCEALIPAAGVLNMRVGVVVGGTSIGRQVDELRRGVDVLIATPGRLIDLLERHAVRLDDVRIAVLDEADHMADLGFMPAVTRILDATPNERQGLFFSATLDRAVGTLVTRYLDNPAIHAVGSAAANVSAMEHQVLLLEHADKVTIAAEIGARPGRTLFFVRTKHGADRLAKQLTRMGVDSAAIHGNLNQNQRTRALDAFTSGRCRVLTATDVAARGIHVDDLDLVVHYDPPNDAKTYLHRSGRTARAGASGTVVSFVEPAQAREVAGFHREATIHPQISRVRPGDQAVRTLAESGEPVVVTPLAHRAPAARPAGGGSGAPAGGPRRGGRGRRRPDRPAQRPRG